MEKFVERRPSANLVVVSALGHIHRTNKTSCDCTDSCSIITELGTLTSDCGISVLVIRRAHGRGSRSVFSVVSNAGNLVNTTSNTFILDGSGHASGGTALSITNESRRSVGVRLMESDRQLI